jgi:hypothetical protein
MRDAGAGTDSVSDVGRDVAVRAPARGPVVLANERVSDKI